MESGTSKKTQGAWLKVFCPDARCLTEEEIVEIPQEARERAESGSEKGLWVEIFCPDDACLKDEERMDIPVRKLSASAKGGVWLNMFCPDEQCVITDPSDLA